MDPKTAATVTSPDLLKAFQEGHGLELDSEGEDVKTWVAFLINNKTVRATTFLLLSDAIFEVALHLQKGEGHAVGIVMSAHHPAEIEAVSDTGQ